MKRFKNRLLVATMTLAAVVIGLFPAVASAVS